jgi:tetratricopeptide (TPR) repeat protein
MSETRRTDKETLRAEALQWWQRGQQAQGRGDLDEAIELYSRSLEIFPTAEAYTFRGWAYSFQERLNEAIAECHKAIETDPDFGNPYNDIGAYLIQQGDYFNAIPWLNKALTAKRYEARHYPWFNLGQIYEAQQQQIVAMNCYRKAFALNSSYTQALKAFRRLQAVLS